MLPAAGQGSICVECRREDNQLIDLVRTVNDGKTEQEVRLEREILYLLGGNCHTVISVYASTDKETNKISVKLQISEENGDNLFRVSDSYSLDEYEEIAKKISKRMIKKILNKENQIYLNHRLNLYPRVEV
jgi:hydroxymethylbilane synthase